MQEWNATASDLNDIMLNLLWNDDIQFWIVGVQGTNFHAVGRQLLGRFPYRLDIGTDESFVKVFGGGSNE